MDSENRKIKHRNGKGKRVGRRRERDAWRRGEGKEREERILPV